MKKPTAADVESAAVMPVSEFCSCLQFAKTGGDTVYRIASRFLFADSKY